MTWDTIVGAIAIAAGAVVMTISIVRFKPILETASILEPKERKALERFLKIHRLLMGFFLLGYVVVLLGVLFDYAFASTLMVSAIFFFGALFVYTGILLQRRMLRGVLNQAKANLKREQAEKRTEVLEGLIAAVDESLAAGEAEAEAERRNLLQAQSENKAKSRFLASMSHEIRTPMNAMLGYSQLLQREPGLTARQQEYLETIDRSGQHLLSLINDVLDMAKIEAGQITRLEGPVNLARMIVELERMFHLQAMQKGLELTVVISKDFPAAIQTDGGKVRQVLINLLSNAVKFTSEGAVTLTLEASQGHEDAVRIIVSVEDTGPGIAPEQTDVVFGAFKQAESGVPKVGTGLGLAVSREFARLLGGELSVTSELGRGSVFRFEFNAKSLQAIEETVLDAAVVGLTPKSKVAKVLVVDDQADNRNLLCAMLRMIGLTVRAASGGEEALEAVASESLDLVLLDLRMPGMDGFEVLEQLRLRKDEPKLPVVIVSASALEDEQKQVLESGADGFLSKPIREHELFAMVQSQTGVEYRYANQYEEPQSVAASQDAGQPSLGDLPPAVADGLYAAAKRGDIAAIDTYVDQASDYDRSTGLHLRRLADSFDYEALASALEPSVRS